MRSLIAVLTLLTPGAALAHGAGFVHTHTDGIVLVAAVLVGGIYAALTGKVRS